MLLTYRLSHVNQRNWYTYYSPIDLQCRRMKSIPSIKYRVTTHGPLSWRAHVAFARPRHDRYLWTLRKCLFGNVSEHCSHLKVFDGGPAAAATSYSLMMTSGSFVSDHASLLEEDLQSSCLRLASVGRETRSSFTGVAELLSRSISGILMKQPYPELYLQTQSCITHQSLVISIHMPGKQQVKYLTGSRIYILNFVINSCFCRN